MQLSFGYRMHEDARRKISVIHGYRNFSRFLRWFQTENGERHRRSILKSPIATDSCLCILSLANLEPVRRQQQLHGRIQIMELTRQIFPNLDVQVPSRIFSTQLANRGNDGIVQEA